MRQARAGFTLVEIMLVLILLGTIAVFVIPKVTGQAAAGKIKTTCLNLEGLKSQVELFYFNENRYPRQEEGLDVLLKPSPNFGGQPYLDTAKRLKDAWGNKILYTTPGPGGKPFDLISLGSNKERGGTGEAQDRSVWDESPEPAK